jgi:hypothetical protein
MFQFVIEEGDFMILKLSFLIALVCVGNAQPMVKVNQSANLDAKTVLPHRDIVVEVDYDTPLIEQIVAYDKKFARAGRAFVAIQKLSPPRTGKIETRVFTFSIPACNNRQADCHEPGLTSSGILKALTKQVPSPVQAANIWEVLALMRKDPNFLEKNYGQCIIAPGILWTSDDDDQYVPALCFTPQFYVGPNFRVDPWYRFDNQGIWRYASFGNRTLVAAVLNH